MRKIGGPGGAVGAQPTMVVHGVGWGTGKIDVFNDGPPTRPQPRDPRPPCPIPARIILLFNIRRTS